MTTEQSGPYYELEVVRIIEETADARSLVFGVPDGLKETFKYRAGQFLTFGVTVEEHPLVRCYSLASSPDVDAEKKVTVKRVAEGRASNWFNDHVTVGDVLKVMKPAGNFCLQDRSTQLVLFAGGSGITPVISLVKSALATTQRSIQLVYANRDEGSIIFRKELDELASAHADRLEVVHRLDEVDGFLDVTAAGALISNALSADFYVCGPGAYMDVVEAALATAGVPSDRIFIERFLSPELEALDHPAEREEGEASSKVVIYLDGQETELVVGEGETILEACHRAGLDAPCACLEGYCGACMALVKGGTVEMRENDGGLDDSQVAEGWVLTCQGLLRSEGVRVEYPDA
ncbi:MAG: 3-ketosteroid-9-alpha-hydroxylase [Deltaproteobacteria bacterium]|nr:3-ketosteroid-9-alpha-hydroxylase [Deltaproteobacteria bacterium]